MKARNHALAFAAVSMFFSFSPLLAEEAPSAAPAAPAAAPENKVDVLRLVLTKELTDREPGAEITTAAVGDVVIGWTQIVTSAGETTITHRWLHEDENAGDVSLAVKSSPWRTWSRKTVSEPGHWKFQVLNAEGAVLKEAAFTVTAAAAEVPAATPPATH
jgi:hypothetical protein